MYPEHLDIHQFSKREKEVMKLLLQGKSNKQIALSLGIAQSTVEYHLKNVYKKLQVSSRTEAVLLLGKSIGDDLSSELGESIVEIGHGDADNNGQPISTRRIPMNKTYLVIGGLLTTALVVMFILVREPVQSAKVAPTIIASNGTEVPAEITTETPIPTPTPLSTFPAPYSKMSDPALDLTDIRVNAKNDLMTAILYLNDVASELTFDKEGGVEINGIEYMWKICVDTDSNKNTGSSLGFAAGSDYCMSAIHFKSSHTPKTMPIEQGVQVNIWELGGESENHIADGTIEVDTDGNTIKLSGKIPGITNSSQFYYEIYDGDYGAMDISGLLFDRLLIEE
jgi:DNA-binding CsgD family transcriptional regulator